MNPRARAFTLIELMLAVSIMAVIMMLVYGIVVSTIQAQERIEEVTLATEVGPVILNQVRMDLEAAFLPDDKKDWFVGVDRSGSSGSRDRIDFISGVVELGMETPESEPKFHSVNEIGYMAEDSKNHPGEFILYRRRDTFIDESPLKGGPMTALYDRVMAFDLKFWNGTEWLDSWASKANGNAMPKGIKVELKLAIPDAVAEGGAVQRTYAITVVPPR